MVDWTEQKIATVIRMWNDGESAAEIGRTIKATRSAVIGKVKRMRDSGMGIIRPPDFRRTPRGGRPELNPAESTIQAEADQKLHDQRSLYILQRHEEDGASFTQIAEELGETQRAVSGHYSAIMTALSKSEKAA